jgi:hypothetical protein
MLSACRTCMWVYSSLQPTAKGIRDPVMVRRTLHCHVYSLTFARRWGRATQADDIVRIPMLQRQLRLWRSMERLQESTVCHHHHNTDNNTKTALTQIVRCRWACESKTAQTYHKWLQNCWLSWTPDRNHAENICPNDHISSQKLPLSCVRGVEGLTHVRWCINTSYTKLSKVLRVIGLLSSSRNASSVQNCGYCLDHPVTKLLCRRHRTTVSYWTGSWWMGTALILRHHFEWYMTF